MKHYKEFKKYCENECMINKEICGDMEEEKDCYIAFVDSKYSQATETTKTKISFKSKTQLPLFMITKEYYIDAELYFASVLFSSDNILFYIKLLFKGVQK